MVDAGLGVAVDSNVLVCVEGTGNAPRCAAARELLARLATDEVMLPVQGLGAIRRVLTRRSRRSEQQARDAGGDAWRVLLATNVVSLV